MATRFRRDASASIFAFGVAGVALALVAIERAPDWAVTTLRAAQAVEWVAGALVLVLLALCVVRTVSAAIPS